MGAWFSKKQHKLPKFPGAVAATFRAICEVLDDDGIAELRIAVNDYKQSMLNEKSAENFNIDLRQMDEIAQRCYYLLDHYNDYSDKQKGMIVGAVRYFAVAEDCMDETAFSAGFHDDASVINYVLEELGIEDRYLDTD